MHTLRSVPLHDITSNYIHYYHFIIYTILITCIYKYIYIYIYMYMYILIRVHVYIYTYIHNYFCEHVYTCKNNVYIYIYSNMYRAIIIKYNLQT